MIFGSSRPIKAFDYLPLARRRLPRMIFDYLEGGADEEQALKRNRTAFDRWRFKPCRLVDVSQRSLATSLFGAALPMPLIIGPTGLNALFWPAGDQELARAAGRAGIPFVLSTASNASIEEVADAVAGDLWFQLYIIHRELADQLVTRARDADYSTLVVTVDVAVNGFRERDMRNGFGLPLRYTPRMLLDAVIHPRWSASLLRHGIPQFANFVAADAASVEAQAALMSRQMDASFGWDDLARIRDRWPRKLLVKGLVDPQDAARALEVGADGVILSNHGGRQLEGIISPMASLGQTVAVAGDAPVLVDSGFRHGSEIVKALALGARAVLLGRATLYGLAARGGAGVDDVLRLLREEMDRTLAQIGCPSAAALTPDYLAAELQLT